MLKILNQIQKGQYQSTCPLMGAKFGGFCTGYHERATCMACEVVAGKGLWRLIRVFWAMAMLNIQRLALRALSTLFLIMILLVPQIVRPATAAADHNPAHSCAILWSQIQQGAAGGTYFLSPDGKKLVWTDLPMGLQSLPKIEVAKYVFAIFYNGAGCTISHLDNRSYASAVSYIRRAAGGSGILVSLGRALSYFKGFAEGMAKGVGNALSAPILIIPRGLFQCIPVKDRKGNIIQWKCPPGRMPPGINM